MAGDMQDNARGHGSRLRIAAWSTAAALVLLPLAAMQVTDEVNWSPGDFAFAGALIAGVGLAFEAAVRVSASRAYRAGTAAALAAAFLLTWINLAVGIIGNEDNPANLMYFGVIAVALVGAALARFRAGGMARAMRVAAFAQAVVALVALVAGLGFTGPITVFFCALWLSSAWLFSKATRERVVLGAPR